MFFYVLIFLAIVVFLILKSPAFKGRLGEAMVMLHTKQHFNESYQLLNNCTLPDLANGTTQIDHILLSPYGIFVIETKNYKGWIFGSEKQKVWTQKLYQKSYQFQNPLHQNYKHIKVLEFFLSDVLMPEYIHSLIVFTPQSTFKTTMPENVFQGAEWVKFVKNFDKEVISPIKLRRVKYRIQKEVLEPSWRTNQIHIQNLKQKHLE